MASFLEIVVQHLTQRVQSRESEDNMTRINGLDQGKAHGQVLVSKPPFKSDVSQGIHGLEDPRRVQSGVSAQDPRRIHSVYALGESLRQSTLGSVENKQESFQKPRLLAKPVAPMEDIQVIEDFSSDDEVIPVNSKMIKKALGDTPSVSTVNELKNILFAPDRVKCFPPEWIGKGFQFNNHPDMSYGLIQIKGGPCGLLAALQSHILRILISQQKPRDRLRPIAAHCEQALVFAIADILWNTNKTSAYLVLTTPGKGDLFNQLSLLRLYSLPDLQQAIKNNLKQFTSHSGDHHGIIQLLLSAILSRGVAQIRQDMDHQGNTLMGRHGYCTQVIPLI